MSNMLSIRQAAQRSKQDGISVTEYALRLWIRRGELPVRYAGSKALIYYPALVQFVTRGELSGGVSCDS